MPGSKDRDKCSWYAYAWTRWGCEVCWGTAEFLNVLVRRMGDPGVTCFTGCGGLWRRGGLTVCGWWHGKVVLYPGPLGLCRKIVVQDTKKCEISGENGWFGPMWKKVCARILKNGKTLGLAGELFCIEKKERVFGYILEYFGPGKRKNSARSQRWR